MGMNIVLKQCYIIKPIAILLTDDESIQQQLWLKVVVRKVDSNSSRGNIVSIAAIAVLETS